MKKDDSKDKEIDASKEKENAKPKNTTRHKEPGSLETPLSPRSASLLNQKRLMEFLSNNE